MKTKTITVTGRRVMEYAETFRTAAFQRIPARAVFNYAMGRNIETIGKLAQSLQDSLKYPPDVEAYVKGRDDLAYRFAKRDENGKPIIVDGGVRIDEMAKFRQASDAYAAEHAATAATLKNINDDYERLLDAQHELRIISLALDDAPDGLPPVIFGVLQDFIEPPSQLVNDSPESRR